MRMLLSVPLFFPHGFWGGQVYVTNIAKELRLRGYDVTILSSAPWQGEDGDYKVESYEYEDLKVVAVKVNPDNVAEEEKYSELSPILINGLCDVLTTLKPEFLHINGLKPALIRLCNQLNIPYVVTAHHPGVACPASTSLRPDEDLCDKVAGTTNCIPCCSKWRVSNYPLSAFVGVLLGHVPQWLYRLIGAISGKYKRVPFIIRALRYPQLVEKMLEGDKVILHESRFIISPSQAMRELLIRNGVAPEKIFLVPHGIDPLPLLPIEPFNDRAIRFGFIGSFDFAKGLHILIEALGLISRQENCELHIYGGSTSHTRNNYLTECLKNYKGKARIINHGYIPHENLVDAYKLIDVLVVPSIFLEVFGLVILEAFSAGRPVIASKSGGPTELVKDGVDGFIVERNEGKSLAQAMQRFIDDPALIVEMSKQIPHVRTIQEHVDDLEKIYVRLLAEKTHV